MLPDHLIRIEEYTCWYYVRVVELSFSIPRGITPEKLFPFVDGRGIHFDLLNGTTRIPVVFIFMGKIGKDCLVNGWKWEVPISRRRSSSEGRQV